MASQIFTKCAKCGGELLAFGTRCSQCGPLIGAIDVQCRASDAADAAAYMLHSSYAESRDKSLTERLPKATDADISAVAGRVSEIGLYRGMKIIEAFRGPQWTKADIETIKATREIRAEVDKACGLPAFNKVESAMEANAKRGLGTLPAAPRKHVSDAAWEAQARLLGCDVNDAGLRDACERGRRAAGCVLITVAQHDALVANRAKQRRGLTPEVRDRAERVVGDVAGTQFDPIADDSTVVWSLVWILERALKLRRFRVGDRVTPHGDFVRPQACADVDHEAQGQIEHLDRENARLRRELAAMKASRDGWRDQAGVWVSTAAELRRRLYPDDASSANVTRIEPFPEVKPYDGDWIPPAHRPRVAP